MHEKILALAEAMLSPSPEEEPILDALCVAAAASLQKELRSGILPGDCGESFPCAAAMLAAAAFLPCRGETDVTAFTAGDLHMTMGSAKGGDGSLALRREARSLMAPFCGDSGFAFMGVRG